MAGRMLAQSAWGAASGLLPELQRASAACSTLVREISGLTNG
jgi:hypothetical protein